MPAFNTVYTCEPYLAQLMLHVIEVEHAHFMVWEGLKVSGSRKVAELNMQEAAFPIVGCIIVPQVGLSQPVPLAFCAPELKRLMHHVWLDFHHLCAVLFELE